MAPEVGLKKILIIRRRRKMTERETIIAADTTENMAENRIVFEVS